jgi:dsRNA-specific ribonuclease
MMARYSFIILSLFCLFFCKNQPKMPNSSEIGGQSGLTMQADFGQRYPNAQDVVWDTLESGFAALFLDSDFDNKAYFDIKGAFQYTVTFIEQKDLPTVVQEILEKKYKDASAAVIMRVENGQSRSYQIELETSTDYINLEFDNLGKLLKEEKHPLSNEEIQRQEEEGVDDKK